MAKVYLDADIEAISGRLSKTKSAMYVRNSHTGKCYRSEYNDERQQSNTALQQEVKEIFTNKAKATQAWWIANKPASDTATPTAEWTAMTKAYLAQRKYGNRYAFVRSRVKDDNTVTFTGTTTPTTPSNGNSQQSGGQQSGGGDDGMSNDF